MRHREERLRAVGAEDLAAFRSRCRDLPPGSAALEPLPRLVVVVDEFATLAAELPDFLSSLVGIAQRGPVSAFTWCWPPSAPPAW